LVTGGFFVVDAKVLTAENFRRIVTGLSKVFGFDIADVQKSVSTYTEIDERRLDARFDVDDFTFIDVSYPIVLTGSFRIEFFESPVF
jgi:hypothetical protein